MAAITAITPKTMAAFESWAPTDLMKRAIQSQAMVALGAVDEAGVSCGVAILEGVGSTAFIRHLEADASAPESSAAFDLVSGICEVAQSSNMAFVEAVLCSEDEEALLNLRNAYTVCGFSMQMDVGCQFSLNIAGLLADPALRLEEEKQSEEKICTLPRYSEKQMRHLNDVLRRSNQVYLPLPLEYESFMPEYSVVSVDAAGQITGALLFGQPQENEFSLIAMALKKSNYLRQAHMLIGGALKLIGENPKHYSSLCISAITPESEKLVRRLVSGSIISETEAYTLRRALFVPPDIFPDPIVLALQELQATEEDLPWTI